MPVIPMGDEDILAEPDCDIINNARLQDCQKTYGSMANHHAESFANSSKYDQTKVGIEANEKKKPIKPDTSAIPNDKMRFILKKSKNARLDFGSEIEKSKMINSNFRGNLFLTELLITKDLQYKQL